MNLYISDLDGTLLNSNSDLSDFSRKNLIKLLNSGIHFTVASARSVVSIQKILSGINFKLPIIEFNGAFISDLKTGKHEIINDIPEKFEIYELLKTNGRKPFVSTFNGREDRLCYSELQNEGMHWYHNDRIRNQDKRLQQTSNPEVALQEFVVCFTIIEKKENLFGLKKILSERFGSALELHIIENIYNPGWYWLTIHNNKASKDIAAKTLCKKFGFDNLTVFGDNHNDISMFKVADHAIAVSNAEDELKQLATEIIGPNDYDAVIKYILAREGI
jgi:5-amino-6-(5-phospho-D-ribitylamino)uracil phosphatase